MWPKAISQLIELAPHVSRLIPMADRYFSGRAGGGDSSKTLEQMEALRGDLGQVTASHVSIRSQMLEQTELLSTNIAKVELLAAQLKAVERSTAAMENRLGKVEAGFQKMTLLLAGLLLVGGISLVLLIAVLVRQH